MDIVLNFIKENNSIIMAALFIIILVLTSIVVIKDIINKKKNKLSMIKLLNDSQSSMTDAFNEKIVEDNSLYYTNDLSELTLQSNIEDEIEEIKYVDEDDELEKTKAQIELKNLKEELLKAEQIAKEEELHKEEIPIEESNIPTKDEILDQFELSQEENAIISLDEFNKISDRVYEENEEIQYKDEGNEPISIQELEALYNVNIKEKTPSNEIEVLETKDNLEEEDFIKEPVEPQKLTEVVPTKFKSSPIISPVFGIDSNTTDVINNIEVENTANLDKLSEEIKKTTEVLNTLKELRKNL